jgi:hydroxyacylglutathione hydrolase
VTNHELNDLQIYTYFTSETMMNTYVVWHRDRREAILVDPVVLDPGLFEIIESNDLEIMAVLLTHAHEEHFKAVKTIPKIYHHARLYGGSDRIYDIPVENLKQTPRFFAAGFPIDPVFLPGHHSDSLLYLLEGLLFTGDLLSAGSLAVADGGYGRKLLCQCIRETLFELSEHTLILPLYGPPSTLGIEKETNAVLQELC